MALLWEGFSPRADYGDSALDDDIFWLRVHRMAERLKIRALQGIDFQKLQLQFGHYDVPSPAFVHELYNDGDNSALLKKYIVDPDALAGIEEKAVSLRAKG